MMADLKTEYSTSVESVLSERITFHLTSTVRSAGGRFLWRKKRMSCKREKLEVTVFYKPCDGTAPIADDF